MKKKHPGGRPSKFPTIDQEQLKILVLDGYTDERICRFFGITHPTLNKYKREKPEFFTSLKDWKLEADAKVEKSLYQRAIGYQYDEVTYEKSNVGGLGVVMKAGEIKALKHTPTAKAKVVVKEVAPDVTAQIFWLKNRQPKVWRDKIDHEHTVPDELVEALKLMNRDEMRRFVVCNN